MLVNQRLAYAKVLQLGSFWFMNRIMVLRNMGWVRNLRQPTCCLAALSESHSKGTFVREVELISDRLLTA